MKADNNMNFNTSEQIINFGEFKFANHFTVTEFALLVILVSDLT